LEWIRLVAEFNKEMETNISFRIINSIPRYRTKQTIYQDLEYTLYLMNKYPEYVVGFDLDDEEDRFHTLLFYIEDFLNIEKETKYGPRKLKYFFHAGETKWNDRTNLFDAVLLNTTRIGHGFALKNSKVLMDIVKQKKIAIEICPISNQLLRLVDDLRNHPANTYMANGLPLVLSNDDPLIYGNDGLSYDFYVATLAWNLKLRALKQFALNSLIYCELSPDEKSRKIELWNQNWKVFIESIIESAPKEYFKEL